jgi:hypothetical protein
MALMPELEAMERGHEALARGAWAQARAAFGDALGVAETAEAYEGLGVAARYELDAAGAFDAHERGYRLARAAGDAAAWSRSRSRCSPSRSTGSRA